MGGLLPYPQPLKLNMLGEVTKITSSYSSYNLGQEFRVFTFRMGDGRSAKTYSSPQYRNWSFWKTVKRGDVIEGLLFFNEKTRRINADGSHIIIQPNLLPNLFGSSI